LSDNSLKFERERPGTGGKTVQFKKVRWELKQNYHEAWEIVKPTF